MGVNAFKLFGTNKDSEKNGVLLTYEDADLRFLVARSGGHNQEYTRMLQSKLRPHRRQIDRGTLSDKKATDILIEVFAKTVVRRVDVWDGEADAWKEGVVPTPEGAELPCNPNTVQALLQQLPDLFADIQSVCRSAEMFQDEEDEEDEGNS